MEFLPGFGFIGGRDGREYGLVLGLYGLLVGRVVVVDEVVVYEVGCQGL